MAEETNQVEKTVQETVQEQVEETPQAEEKPSNVTVDEDGTIKLDLRQQEQT